MRFEAMRIRQPSGREVFAFATTAQHILATCTIPRIQRNSLVELEGYQRPEVAGHIAEIRDYFEAPDAVLPNTIVVAFDDRVSFVAGSKGQLSDHGYLDVPEPASGESSPGFVVDGQQRLAALASSRIESFPVFVTALVGCDLAEQRKQFVLVNNSRPLPPGLIFELLPEIEGHLPARLGRQRLAAELTGRLNLDPDSPLYQRIKTPTCPVGTIKDNSVRRMLLNSLSDGALLAVRRQGGEDVTGGMAQVVASYWNGVRQVFPAAFDLPPKQSRLTHGVGFVSMGYVMDHLYLANGQSPWTPDHVAAGLEPLAERCAWTKGAWALNEGARPWNELQNIDRDIRKLAGYLVSRL